MLQNSTKLKDKEHIELLNKLFM